MTSARPFATHPGVTAIRSLFAQRQWAVLICTAALMLKLLVPTGFMIGTVGGHVAIILCSGNGPAATATTTAHAAAMTMPEHAMAEHAKAGHAPGHSEGEHGREMPCAFAGLAAPALAAVDPIQLVLFIAFIMAIGLVTRAVPRLVSAPYLRPPLRGPPALS